MSRFVDTFTEAASRAFNALHEKNLVSSDLEPEELLACIGGIHYGLGLALRGLREEQESSEEEGGAWDLLAETYQHLIDTAAGVITTAKVADADREAVEKLIAASQVP